MSETKSTCPICNEKTEPGQSSCPRCGFKLIGNTQAFNPVTAPDDAASVGDDVGTPALEVITGPYAGESFILDNGTFTLGRDPKCDIFLSNMTVSRHNSTLIIDGENVKIVDAGSTNGTWVNGFIVDEAELTCGSHVQIGTFDMVFKRIKPNM